MATSRNNINTGIWRQLRTKAKQAIKTVGKICYAARMLFMNSGY